MKRTAITDADRRSIRRRRNETGQTQAETAPWFAAQPEVGPSIRARSRRLCPLPTFISTMIIEKTVSYALKELPKANTPISKAHYSTGTYRWRRRRLSLRAKF